MKCQACGYTDDAAPPEAQEVKAEMKQRWEPFIELTPCTFPQIPQPQVFKQILDDGSLRHFEAYACPSCGTVRVKLQHEPA